MQPVRRSRCSLMVVCVFSYALDWVLTLKMDLLNRLSLDWYLIENPLNNAVNFENVVAFYSGPPDNKRFSFGEERFGDCSKLD
jgi:hypothetical protein